MNTDFPLYLPLLFIFFGFLIALAYSIQFLNKRLSVILASWVMAIFPFAAFVSLLTALAQIQDGSNLTITYNWLPSLKITASLYFDNLSAVFGLLVSGIGTLVIIYSGYYFKGDRTAWRFFAYMFLFMFAMLGLVLAGNLILLFIFWEITSVVSFLLVAYKYKSEEARRGAFKALLITGTGGVALLIGIILIFSVTGSAEIPDLLFNSDLLRKNDLYLLMLSLIALAAFTKSAQTPFHIWLPDAMSAPTPASAYLHSATMVKAGIYLLARLNPVLGMTEQWFWIFSLIGLITMLTGAYLGFKQNDLKALLAYSTISQLGVMVLLIGQDTDIAFKALVISVIAHALYKSALFLVAGIVDHQTGTRDLQELGGLARWMPYSMGIAILAALSMAGLPPMFGFLAKETLLATSIHPTLPNFIAALFPAAAVAAGAFILAQAALFVWGTFLGRQRNPEIKPREANWGMLIPALIPAFLSIMLGLLPEPQAFALFLSNAASAAYSGKVKVSLALWAGLTVPVILSIIAVVSGILIFVFRDRVRKIQSRIAPHLSVNNIYIRFLGAVENSGVWVTKLQGGKLRTYLTVMLFSLIALVIVFTRVPEMNRIPLVLQPTFNLGFAISVLRIFALVVIISAALASVFIRRDFAAILTLGAMGLSVAVLMVLEPDPDLALVQMVVDLLAVVILVLALTRLPRSQRMRASELTYKQSRYSLARDILVSVALGALVAWIAMIALLTRPRESVVTPFFEANAKILTGAKDIVGAIVVDFRAFDTLLEISVFSIAGLGIYTLLLYASRLAGDEVIDEPLPKTDIRKTAGIGGPRTSSFVHALAYASLPFSLILAIVHMMYGHDQPGDGFTAGVIVGLVVAFWYVVFGYSEVKARLWWLKPMLFISSGILLAVFTGIIGVYYNGSFLSNVNFGVMIGIPLPEGFNLSTSFLFEVAIFLSVLGSISYILRALGHPRIGDLKSKLAVNSLEKSNHAEKN
jgi:multicomponent K+:H+ antiporter subunit A